MMKVLGIIILIIFYGIYLGKMLIQKHQGIQTDQIAKGKKDKVYYVEIVMKVATYMVILVELDSILFCNIDISNTIQLIGFIIGILGDVIFALAVITMKDSWRAGIAAKDKTKMIKNGIYSISRNPAFLGFDLVYLGILIMFFNYLLLLFTLFAMIMLHLQILQEENYLPTVFNDEYIEYKNKVNRYLGRH